MKKNSKTDEFFKISGGILETLENAKDYSKERLKLKIENLIESFNFVKKEDFDLLSQMCIKINKENQNLNKKIKILEKKLLKN